MPIRTSRGRSAAYRGVWQWPLRSPARLAVTVLVIVAVAALVGVLAGANGRSDSGGIVGFASPTSAPQVASPPAGNSFEPLAAPTASVLPPVPALAPTTLPLSQAPPAALQVAARWAAAWVRPPGGTTAQQWLDGLRPTTTDEFLGVLTTVDPSSVPATRVTGAPKAVQVAARSVQVDVPTDALTLLVTVVDTDTGGWRVSDYDRA
jgi:hypothetical protein